MGDCGGELQWYGITLNTYVLLVVVVMVFFVTDSVAAAAGTSSLESSPFVVVAVVALPMEEDWKGELVNSKVSYQQGNRLIRSLPART